MSLKVDVTVTGEIRVTPRWLAELFTAMTADEQAAFFAHVEQIAGLWDAPEVFQWHQVSRHVRVSGCGERVLRELAACLDETESEAREGIFGESCEVPE